MRFTIVGAGALGTILGAHLIAAGHAVRMVARGQRAERIATDGLVVRGLVDLKVPCETLARPEALEADETLIFAVKTYHMAAAIAGTHHLRPDSVFSVANGVMKNEQLAEAFSAPAVLGCMANFSGELCADHSVLFTRNVRLFIGDQKGRGKAIADAIDAAGVAAQASDTIDAIEWSKFVGWLALFSVSVLSRTATWRALVNEHFSRLAAGLIKEAAGIATARRIPLLDQSPMPVQTIAELPLEAASEAVRAVGRELETAAPDHRMSSLQDLEAGRELEVEETLGYAVRESSRLGLETPLLRTCYALGAGLNTLHK